MVYDCFPFFNELDILKLRLNIMDPYVDRFVLEEAAVTFSGQPKPLYYARNKGLFRQWEHKIIHIVVEDCPAGLAPHDMDHYQKDHLLEGLKDCDGEDICLFSDVDEIPNPEIFAGLFPALEKGKIYHLAQRLFYCFVNMEEVSGRLLSNSGEFEGVDKPQWLGTKVFFYGSLQGRGFWDLRDRAALADGVRVANGGWHFGYMGGSQETDLARRIEDKVAAAAHQEYNSKELLADSADKIRDGGDIFGREARFVMRTIDETYPEYLRTHQEDFAHFMLKKETPGDRRKRQWKRRLRRGGEKGAKLIRRLKKIMIPGD